MPAALKRKGKDDGIPEAHSDGGSDLSDVMENVVLTHNSMNEMAWGAVKRWESLHPESCSDVKLNRFLGRPNDLSPLARLRLMMGWQRPFDRHDWYILRDGKEVRYVIDFYFDEEKAGSPQVWHGHFQ
jgi:cytochrome c heme-lyase